MGRGNRRCARACPSEPPPLGLCSGEALFVRADGLGPGVVAAPPAAAAPAIVVEEEGVFKMEEVGKEGSLFACLSARYRKLLVVFNCVWEEKPGVGVGV